GMTKYYPKPLKPCARRMGRDRAGIVIEDSEDPVGRTREVQRYDDSSGIRGPSHLPKSQLGTRDISEGEADRSRCEAIISKREILGSCQDPVDLVSQTF